MRIVAFAIFIAALAGCATKPPPDLYVQCLESVAADIRYTPIRSKLAVAAVKDQSIDMMSNKTYATEEDKPLILSWSNARQACYNKNPPFGKMHPKLALMVDRVEAARNKLAANLYAGNITYGEFAQGRQAAYEVFESERVEFISGKMQDDEQRRRQVLLMQYQALQNRPAPTPMPAPYMMPTNPTVTMNCIPIGNQISCTSR